MLTVRVNEIEFISSNNNTYVFFCFFPLGLNTPLTVGLAASHFQVKRALSTENYKVFHKTLVSYKKTGNFTTMVTQLADLFTDDPNKHQLFRSKTENYMQ